MRDEPSAHEQGVDANVERFPNEERLVTPYTKVSAMQASDQANSPRWQQVLVGLVVFFGATSWWDRSAYGESTMRSKTKSKPLMTLTMALGIACLVWPAPAAGQVRLKGPILSPDLPADTCESWLEQAKLTASDADAYDYFGKSVAISSDRLVVGAVRDDDAGSASGSAYVFRYDGTGWVEQIKLTASDADVDDRFGASIAIDGDTIVVGAYGNDDAGSGSGSAYVFRYDGTNWFEQAKLTASDAAADDYFGWSVTIDGDNIVVGAYEYLGSGSAYVFRYNGTDWVEQTKLIASHAAWGDRFGWAVAIDGDTIVVGAWGNESAYVFHYDGANWSEQAKLTAFDGAWDDYFGGAVAIDGDTIAVGARYDDDARIDSGSAYVFGYNGTNWVEQAKLTASDGAWHGYFGGAVAIDGDTVVVGAIYGIGDVNTGTGSAYVFHYDGMSWIEQAKLTASDGVFYARFGDSVAIDGKRLVVGRSNRGNAAYVFEFVEHECPECLSDADCDDGVFCNGTETCDSNFSCQPAVAPCEADRCDEESDLCYECLADGDCDDGIFCNGAEICDSISGCQPGINPCPDSICNENASQCAECLADSDCDDGNVCTDDLCAEGICEHVDNAAACNDGNACTDDVCSDGLCVSIPNTAPCADDGSVCTDDVCSAGVCTHPASDEAGACASDGDICTDDVCSGGVCTHPAGNEGGACDDGLACTDPDTCSGGVCTGDPLDGPPVGGECDDDVCTEGDDCVAGACQSGTPAECEFDAYTACHPVKGCFFPPLVVRVLESGTGAETLNAAPSEIIELEVFVECEIGQWPSGCVRTYDGYQLDIAGSSLFGCGYDPRPGGSGRLDHCSSCDVDCGLWDSGILEVGPSPNICMQRDDFLFELAMPNVLEPTNADHCIIGAVRFQGQASFLLPDTMPYLMTFVLEVSADASGTFEVGLEQSSLPCDQGADNTKFIDDFACVSLIVVPAVVNIACTSDADCDDDGVFCNGVETCNQATGECQVTDPCPPPPGPSFCHEEVGLCGFCEDDTDCGAPETCLAVPDLGIVGCAECVNDADCDDGNECTTDSCDAIALACLPVHPPVDNGTPCTDDLSFCTGDETCQGGVCTSSGDPCVPPEVCDDDIDQCVPSVTPCYGDLNHDGVVDLDDLLCVMDGFGDASACPQADLHPCGGGDGIIELDDLLALLLAYAGQPPCATACQ